MRPCWMRMLLIDVDVDAPCLELRMVNDFPEAYLDVFEVV